MIELKTQRGNKLLFVNEEFDTLVKVKMVLYNIYELDFINNDGSKAAICGNALMSFATDFLEEAHPDEVHFRLGKIGKVAAYKKDGKITVEMPKVEYEKLDIDKYESDCGNFHELFFNQPDVVIENRYVNSSRIKITNDTTLFVDTYERGVGQTESCGSAACCAAWVYCKEYLKRDGLITVQQRGGDIIIDCMGESPVMVHKL